MSIFDEKKKNGTLSLADLYAANFKNAGLGLAGALGDTPLGIGLVAGALAPSPGSPEFKRAVWRKGRAIDGIDQDQWRYDDDGNLMCFADYGECSEYGWEIDHQFPAALGGSDELSNARPLHWRGNRVEKLICEARRNQDNHNM